VITVLCCGTGTEIGKTWVGAQVLTALRAEGRRVAARKPVQSFDPDDAHPKDAEILAAATGEDVDVVCAPHRSYEKAMAPPIAAMLLGRELGLMVDVVTDMAEPADDTDLLWVETVGGVRSPLADDGDSADVARWVHPDFVVLVADAGLGTINAVRLSAGPFAGRQILVLLNRYDETDDVHRTNAAWLRDEGMAVSISADDLVGFFTSVLR
jgi:dethiobiotin synthetase